jgi:small-conductance mechanosensitive channel
LLSWSIRFVIWILAISMALEELGVARQTVIAAFSIVFGALMLGLAIAFGLGGKDLARNFLERNLGDRKRGGSDEPQPL